MAAKRKKPSSAKSVNVGDVVLVSTSMGELPAMVTAVRAEDERTAYEPDSPPRYVRRIDTVAFVSSGSPTGTLVYRCLSDAEWRGR
jgi:hypothetical protein